MTEIIWDGKYTNGKKTAPIRIALPFQTIETVNESVQERQRTLDFFSEGRPSDWRNRLIWGDKKYVLPSLLPEFAGKVNLIYIDPPFNVGADFSFTATIPDNPDTDDDETTQFTKQPSIIEQKAYRDTWGRGLDSYMQWFSETIILLRELLHEEGTIYVHLDWRVGHYAKCILDEIFGYSNFRNEIVWFYPDSPGRPYDKFCPKHDVIFRYSKSDKFIFNADSVRIPILEASKKRYESPRYLINSQGKKFEYTGGDSAEKGKIPETVWQIPVVKGTSEQDANYPTQKPEALLERILKASSNEGDLVLDCFCGSGTTAAVAEKLNRRWITCDLGRFAIHTTRKRLLSIPNVKPFVVQNLGKYERQQWISSEFENPEQRLSVETAYRNFILELYHAQPIKGYTWLHGVRQGRMIHVGSVETPVAMGDVRNMIQELWKMAGKEPAAVTNGIDVLGWEFAFELNETALQFAAENKVDLRFKKIPREVLEKKAVEQGDIKFFELAHLETALKTEDKKVTITLADFIIPPDDVPDEVKQKITHWSQWIDYWAVDWNYRDDTFHNEWQSYRSKKNPKIELSTSKTFEHAGEFVIIVKVIDILGNDTTKQIKIRI